MARMAKTTERKYNFRNSNQKTRNNDVTIAKDKSSAKKAMLQHLIHPDYVLFDWEFFSNQLEFE